MAPGRPSNATPDGAPAPGLAEAPGGPGAAPRAPLSPAAAGRAAGEWAEDAREGAPEWGEAGGEAVLLPLETLIPDSDGTVVLVNDAGLASVGIVTGERVTDAGAAGAKVTAAGLDVSGFRYVTFESGLTLYYPADLDLEVAAARADEA